MKYDDFWDDDEGSQTAAATELQMVPDGTHSATVKKVDYREVEWKKADNNPKGLCLTLMLEVNGHQPVWADIPNHWRGLTEAVCASAGVHPPVKGEDWDEAQLQGQSVTIQTLQCVAKSGKQYVRIEKWLPGPKLLPKKAAKAPAKKGPTPVIDEAPDDIPF
jgi:hypothetical protein